MNQLSSRAKKARRRLFLTIRYLLVTDDSQIPIDEYAAVPLLMAYLGQVVHLFQFDTALPIFCSIVSN